MAVKLKTKAKPKLALKPTGSVGIGSGLLPGAPRVPGKTSVASIPPPTTPISPFDPVAEAQISARAQAFEHTMANLGQQETDLNREFDPLNPQGRQQMLKNAFQQTRGAQHINQASSGQLYSGSSATEDAFTNQDEGFATADLQHQYTSAMDAIARQRQQANDDTIQGNLDTIRGVTGNYAGSVDNTPMGGNLATTTPARPKASQAEMKARVKARILAKRKAR